MRHLSLAIVTLLILAGCGSSSATYEIHFTKEVSKERESALVSAALRIIERRMANIGEDILDLNLHRKEEKTFIAVQAQSKESLDMLTSDLSAPFELHVMEEASQEEADIVVEGHGGFRKTGLTHEHITWLTASEEEGGKGRVTIEFTDEGRERMAMIFHDNVGGYIGLFVRGQLVSKLQVETDEVKDDIIITDIPSVELANIFADDVNAGLYVQFTQAP